MGGTQSKSKRQRSAPPANKGVWEKAGDWTTISLDWSKYARDTIRVGVDCRNGAGEHEQPRLNGEEHRQQCRLTGEVVRDAIPKVTVLLQRLEKGFRKDADLWTLLGAFLQGRETTARSIKPDHGTAALERIGLRIAGDMQPHTALKTPQRFARQTVRFIAEQASRHGTSKTSKNYFFLYHPDTDWNPEFFDYAKKHDLPESFLGMSESLDALCTWMIFLRHNLKHGRRARFHLLVPAYQPLVISEPLIIPRDLFPLTVTGHIHNSTPYVWFRLPTFDDLNANDLELDNVGLATGPEQKSWSEFFESITTTAAAGYSHAGIWGAGIGALGGFVHSVATSPATEETPPRMLGQGPVVARGPVEAQRQDDMPNDVPLDSTMHHATRRSDHRRRRPEDRRRQQRERNGRR